MAAPAAPSGDSKGRINWTHPLREHFSKCVGELGGLAIATPKKILSTMKVPNLQLAHVKSFLQRQRQNALNPGTGHGHEDWDNCESGCKLSKVMSPRWSSGTTAAADPDFVRPVSVVSLPTLDKLADDLACSYGAAAGSAIQEAACLLNLDSLPPTLGQELLGQGGSEEEGGEEQEQRIGSSRRRRRSRGGGAEEEDKELLAQGGGGEEAGGRGLQHPTGAGVKRSFLEESCSKGGTLNTMAHWISTGDDGAGPCCDHILRGKLEEMVKFEAELQHQLRISDEKREEIQAGLLEQSQIIAELMGRDINSMLYEDSPEEKWLQDMWN
eukprot:gene27224-2477_t